MRRWLDVLSQPPTPTQKNPKNGWRKRGRVKDSSYLTPTFYLPLGFITVTPCYEDQRSSWSAEDQKWHPGHPVRTQRGLQGPVRFQPFDLSAAAKQIPAPAVVSMFVPLFNYSKAPGHSELGIWLAWYGNWLQAVSPPFPSSGSLCGKVLCHHHQLTNLIMMMLTEWRKRLHISTRRNDKFASVHQIIWFIKRGCVYVCVCGLVR